MSANSGKMTKNGENTMPPKKLDLAVDHVIENQIEQWKEDLDRREKSEIEYRIDS